MRLQYTARRVVFPIWIVWLTTSAPIKRCSSQETNDEDLVPPEGGYECVNPCKDMTFCGRDLQCHPYSCENWYMLGHPLMTGYMPDTSPALNCEILENGEDRSYQTASPFCDDGFMPTSVTFRDGCKSRSTCWDGSATVVHLNRKCTSTPRNGFGFVCYDMAPDTDFEAYYEEYIAATEKDLDPINCTEDNETYTEHHIYTSELSYPVEGFVTTLSSDYSSSDFNVTLATRTLVANLFAVNLTRTVFALCENGCKSTEFCGQDGSCHEFNCVNVYDYGPKTVTGHDYQDPSAPQLQCSDPAPTEVAFNTCLYDPSALDADLTKNVESPWPLLLTYQCSPYDYFTHPEACAYDFLDGRYVTFNRFCSASLNEYQDFVCYDMNPDTDMERYLADYLNQTAFHSQCTDDNVRDPTVFEPEEETTAIEYHGRHSYVTCIGSLPPWALYNIDCTFVVGSVNQEANIPLSPNDFERLRYVVRSNLVGSIPNGEEDTSAVATRHVLGTAAAAFVHALLGLLLSI